MKIWAVSWRTDYRDSILSSEIGYKAFLLIQVKEAGIGLWKRRKNGENHLIL